MDRIIPKTFIYLIDIASQHQARRRQNKKYCRLPFLLNDLKNFAILGSIFQFFFQKFMTVWMKMILNWYIHIIKFFTSCCSRENQLLSSSEMNSYLTCLNLQNGVALFFCRKIGVREGGKLFLDHGKNYRKEENFVKILLIFDNLWRMITGGSVGSP